MAHNGGIYRPCYHRRDDPGTHRRKLRYLRRIRVAGVTGAAVATLGCILPSCIIVTLLAYIYFRYRRLSLMRDLLDSLRPAVVALIGSAGLTILLGVLFPDGVRSIASLDWAGTALFVGAFIVLRLKKLNPILTMFICGAVYLAINLALPA